MRIIQMRLREARVSWRCILPTRSTSTGRQNWVAARTGDDESGAVLVLALVVLLVTAGVVVPLMNMVMNDLHNSTNFAAAHTTQAAATSATDLAIQSIRYTPLLTTNQTLLASPPSPCWGTGSISQVADTNDLGSFEVWCSTVWAPGSAATRTVTFSTCVVASTETAALCAANPYLQAVVVFDDYPSGLSAPSTGQCLVYCGNSMTISSWLFHPTVPTVTSMTPSSGSILGGQPVTITGTGFVPGASVNFIEATGSTPSSDNLVEAATGVRVNSSTQISATAPGVISGSNYLVSVTTPSGSSPYVPPGGTNPISFSYSASPPSITSLQNNQGSSSGGTSVIINGSGFVTGATVKFTSTSDGSVVNGRNVNVTSDGQMTAVTPAVISGSTYYVQVHTPTGTTAQSSSYEFTYSQTYPTVSSVTPTSGTSAGNVQVVITGTGFFTGATVTFTPESGGVPIVGGTAIPATGVNVAPSGLSITADTPTGLTAGSSYFVNVKTAPGTSNDINQPIFTATP